MRETVTKAKTKLDIEKIQADFPILRRDIRRKKLIYFDNAATSQKPNQVIDAISDYYSRYNANVHRGVHKLSEEATEAFEAARKKVADFVNAGDSRQIVFTRNATEAINLVADSWGRKNIKKGDEILLTQMEHHSNLVPWQILAREVGARLKFVPINESGELRVHSSELGNLLTPRTKLVGVTHVSNVLGTINPVKQIIEKIYELSAKNSELKPKVLVDGAQAVPHMPVSIQNINPDFYVFTGHKMLGPTGIGVLYAKKELLEEMDPFLYGGDMILEVDWENSSWNYVPWKFEAGTPDISGAVGLGAAVDYLNSLGMKNVREHEKELTTYALEKLSSVKGLVVYGPKDPEERGGVISFNVVKNGQVAIHPHDLASILDTEGIAVRSGHHCAQPLMKVLGIPAAARVSFYIYNTKEEVDKLVPALEKAKKIFKL
ncbi:MAG: cysteine desulfurase [Candidatus Woykebacteria bacterium RBG_16_43_9]|uniref:cysteine desulfurase n=1 Tax=Candidatus Woykebacteria bacterium RBG_16_43_9 TaxID=1802596 RepID=A0A1G1WDB6_9BACT|nr:MAG: cysteine desulfurase [Candidatus Woykebacteria bacterium RBG_16_43_9]